MDVEHYQSKKRLSNTLPNFCINSSGITSRLCCKSVAHTGLCCQSQKNEESKNSSHWRTVLASNHQGEFLVMLSAMTIAIVIVIAVVVVISRSRSGDWSHNDK